jgi:phosphate transport system permease protein
MATKAYSNSKQSSDSSPSSPGSLKAASWEKISFYETVFRKILMLTALGIVVLLLAIMLTLIIKAYPSLKAFGLQFFYGRTWDPVANEFGAFPFLIGTLLTSFLALIISIPFSIAVAILLGEYFAEGIVSTMLKSIIELLAGIPSIIYGFWGLLILVPVIRSLELKINVVPYGVGIFASSIVLAIMIIPYSASLGREVISLVPADIKEAAYSLGATRYEVLKKVILPYTLSGITAGILLSLGRALGETMAVTMVIGNSNYLPKSLFDPSNTMASVIANEFTEATGTLYLSSLIEIGLLLFIVSAIINTIGKYIIKRFGVM